MLWSEKPCNMNCWDGGFNYQDAIRTDEVEFFVTNHQWLENDSLFADLVLPVTTCVEDNDAVGGSMVVSLRHDTLTPAAMRPRQGESKSDFEIACETGRALRRARPDRHGHDPRRCGYASAFDQLAAWRGDRAGRTYKRSAASIIPKLEDPAQDQLAPGMRRLLRRTPRTGRSTRLRASWSSGREALGRELPRRLRAHSPWRKLDRRRAEIRGGLALTTRPLWGERCKDYPLLVGSQPRPFPRACAGRRHQVVPRDRNRARSPAKTATNTSRSGWQPARRRRSRHRGRRHREAVQRPRHHLDAGPASPNASSAR